MSVEYDEKKYISCKNCGCEIEIDRRKCPYCKTINTLASKKSSRKPLVVILSIVCIIVICFLTIILIFNRNNVVLNPNSIKVYSVLNGSGNAVIGERAEITVSKDLIMDLSPEEYNVFLENEVAGSGYNWFTIDFDDGTGIIFAGCDIELSTYCKIGDEGMLKETIGTIKRHSIGNSISFDYEPES